MKTLALDWFVYSTASGIDVLPHEALILWRATGASSTIRPEYDGQLVGRLGEDVQPVRHMDEISYCPTASPPGRTTSGLAQQQVGCASQQNRPPFGRLGSKARITAPQHFCPLHPNKQIPTGRVQCDALCQAA